MLHIFHVGALGDLQTDSITVASSISTFVDAQAPSTDDHCYEDFESLNPNALMPLIDESPEVCKLTLDVNLGTMNDSFDNVEGSIQQFPSGIAYHLGLATTNSGSIAVGFELILDQSPLLDLGSLQYQANSQPEQINLSYPNSQPEQVNTAAQMQFSRFIGANYDLPIAQAIKYFDLYEIPEIMSCQLEEAATLCFYPGPKFVHTLIQTNGYVRRFGFSHNGQSMFVLLYTNNESSLQVFDEMPDRIETENYSEVHETIDNQVLTSQTKSIVDVNESLGVKDAHMDILEYILMLESAKPSLNTILAAESKVNDTIYATDCVVGDSSVIKHTNVRWLGIGSIVINIISTQLVVPASLFIHSFVWKPGIINPLAQALPTELLNMYSSRRHYVNQSHRPWKNPAYDGTRDMQVIGLRVLVILGGWHNSGFIYTRFLKDSWATLVYTYKLGHKLLNDSVTWSLVFQSKSSRNSGQNSLQHVLLLPISFCNV